MTDTNAPRPLNLNKLTELGRAAMHATMRAALLEALTRNDWNVSRAGREFGLDAPNTHRMMRMLDLVAELKAARERASIVDAANGCG